MNLERLHRFFARFTVSNYSIALPAISRKTAQLFSRGLKKSNIAYSNGSPLLTTQDLPGAMSPDIVAEILDLAELGGHLLGRRSWHMQVCPRRNQEQQSAILERCYSYSSFNAEGRFYRESCFFS